MGLTSFVWQGLFNFYELYMVDKGLPPAAARNLLTVIFAAGVPAFLISGDLADRLPHVPYLLGIVSVFLVGVVLVVVSSGLAAVVAASVVVGFAIHMLFPPATPTCSRRYRTGPERRRTPSSPPG